MYYEPGTYSEYFIDIKSVNAHNNLRWFGTILAPGN